MQHISPPNPLFPPYPRTGPPVTPTRFARHPLRHVYLVFDAPKVAEAVVCSLSSAGVHVQRTGAASLETSGALVEVLVADNISTDIIFEALGSRYRDLIAVTDDVRVFDVGVPSHDFDDAVHALESLVLDTRCERRLESEIFFQVVTGPAVSSERIGECLRAANIERAFVKPRPGTNRLAASDETEDDELERLYRWGA